ncbi:hypothetical protein FOZ62_012873, partial [Perkinsus olseni]
EYDTFNKACERCGKKNHCAWCCKAEAPSSRSIQALSLGGSPTRDHAVPVHLNGSSCTFSALLDTGAQACVITMDALTRVPDFRLQSTNVTLVTADGGRPSVIGVAKSVSVRFLDAHEVKTDFIVVSNAMTRDVILSASILREMDAVWLLGRDQLVLGEEASKLASALSGPKPSFSKSAVYQPVVELCNIAIDHAPEESYPDLSVEDLVPDDLLRDLTDAAIPKRKKSATPSPVEDHADTVPDEKFSAFGWELLPPTDDASYGRFQLQVPWKGQERPTSDGNQRCLRRAVATDARLTPLQRSDYLDVFSSLFENHFVDSGSSDVVHLVPSMP